MNDFLHAHNITTCGAKFFSLILHPIVMILSQAWFRLEVLSKLHFGHIADQMSAYLMAESVAD